MLGGLLMLMGVHGCGKTTLASYLRDKYWPQVITTSRSAAKAVYKRLDDSGMDLDALDPFVFMSRTDEQGHIPTLSDYLGLIERMQLEIINEWLGIVWQAISDAQNQDGVRVVITDRALDPIAYWVWHAIMAYAARFARESGDSYSIEACLSNGSHRESYRRFFEKYFCIFDDASMKSLPGGLIDAGTHEHLSNSVKSFVYCALDMYCHELFAKVLSTFMPRPVIAVFLMPPQLEYLKHHEDISLPGYFYDGCLCSYLNLIMNAVFLSGYGYSLSKLRMGIGDDVLFQHLIFTTTSSRERKDITQISERLIERMLS